MTHTTLNSMTEIERILLVRANRGLIRQVASRVRKSASTVSRVFHGKQKNALVSARLEQHFGPLLDELRAQQQAPKRRIAS